MMISVIVPVYNSEQYLLRCVGSIQGQSIQDIEILLIDDGSQDNSPAICDRLAATDSRIRVIHQENKGVAAARNAGLDVAQGDYVTFVDSDDWIEQNMYERMLRVAEEYSCDVVLCDCVKDDRKHSTVYSHEIRKGYYNQDQLRNEYYPHLLMMENIEYPPTISNCLLLICCRCTNLVRYLQGVRYSEDLLFGAQIMLNARSFYYLKGECYYHYCMNPGSATHRFQADKWKDYCRLHQQVKNSLLPIDNYDFQTQIDKMLLFFIYNTVGGIRGTGSLTLERKKKLVFEILANPEVRSMFSRVRVLKLPISWKLKVYTLLYKYQIGIGLLLARG